MIQPSSYYPIIYLVPKKGHDTQCSSILEVVVRTYCQVYLCKLVVVKTPQWSVLAHLHRTLCVYVLVCECVHKHTL